MKFFNKQNNLRMYDDFFYNQQLDFLTKFNLNNNLLQKKFNKIILNFGFKGIKFEKKKNDFIFYDIRINYKSKMYFN